MKVGVIAPREYNEAEIFDNELIKLPIDCVLVYHSTGGSFDQMFMAYCHFRKIHFEIINGFNTWEGQLEVINRSDRILIFDEEMYYEDLKNKMLAVGKKYLQVKS